MAELIIRRGPPVPGACEDCEGRGWDIFDTGDGSYGDFYVQRDDACAVLTEEQAWAAARTAGLPVDDEGWLGAEWNDDCTAAFYLAWRALEPTGGA
jgi:hypothetical protein